MAIKVEHVINLWVVGRANQHFRINAPGSDLPGILFSSGQVTLNVGVTKKDEFTLGQDGTIRLVGFQYFNRKKSILKWLKNIGMNANDYKHYHDWSKIVKIKDECRFTASFFNTIGRRTCSEDLWINRNWDLDGS